jgi:16S rRNA (adenine1518-N6/adenine1519-N6)-dimethyltransferase
MNERMNIQPRKRFGQNFLHDQNVIARILGAIRPRPGDNLVEIGPGQGAISQGLLQGAGRLVAVELDRDLIQGLQEKLQGLGELELHNADALRFDFRPLAARGPLRLIGNLPYNISTPLLFHLLTLGPLAQDMHLMLQKEVVERMAASPGGKDYGRLSVMLQARAEVLPLFDVAPGAFWPVPKVESSVVRVRPYAQSPYRIGSEADFARLVAAAFSQRRKTLANCLKGVLSAAEIQAQDIDPKARAETLSIADFVRLANRLS